MFVSENWDLSALQTWFNSSVIEIKIYNIQKFIFSNKHLYSQISLYAL